MDTNACDLQVSRDSGMQPVFRQRSINLLERSTGTSQRRRWRTSDASELPGSRARSAVFLVHAESPRQAQGGQVQKQPPGRLAFRKRMLSQTVQGRPVTAATYQCRTGRRLEKSSVRPQTGDLLRLPATPCDLGLREEFGVFAYQHPRRGKLPTRSWLGGRDGYGAHSNGLRQKRNRRFRSTCRFEIWKAMIPARSQMSSIKSDRLCRQQVQRNRIPRESVHYQHIETPAAVVPRAISGHRLQQWIRVRPNLECK